MVTERRLPQWLKVKMPGSEGYRQIKGLLDGAQLNTVCAEAQCPNIGECWDRGISDVHDFGRHLHPRLCVLRGGHRQTGRA